MIFIQICAMMTSVSIVSEKEMRTMNLLLVSPIRPRTIILGKLVPYFPLLCIILTLVRRKPKRSPVWQDDKWGRVGLPVVQRRDLHVYCEQEKQVYDHKVNICRCSWCDTNILVGQRLCPFSLFPLQLFFVLFSTISFRPLRMH